MTEREREGAIPRGSVRADEMDEEPGTHPRETRTGEPDEDVAARDAHAPGVRPDALDAESAEQRHMGMPETPADAAGRHGNQAYHESKGRGAELTEQNDEAARTSRRSSHARVSPADRENE